MNCIVIIYVFLSTGLIDDEKSVAGMRKMYRGAIQYKVGLVCYKENSNDIIGMNVTVMSFLKEKKDNPEVRKPLIIPNSRRKLN